MLPEESLVIDLRLATAGDQDAWTRLFLRYRPLLEQWSRALSISAGSELSHADLVQDAWIRVWQGLSQFHGIGAPRETAAAFCQWMRQTARRAMLNSLEYRNAQCRRPESPVGALGDHDPIDAHVDSPSKTLATDDEAIRVRAAVQRLASVVDQQVIQLVFWDGVSLAGASEALGLSYDTTRHRFHSALRELESMIGSDRRSS